MNFVSNHSRKMMTNMPKKVFNWSEVHLSEVTFYKIHTLICLDSYGKLITLTQTLKFEFSSEQMTWKPSRSLIGGIFHKCCVIIKLHAKNKNATLERISTTCVSSNIIICDSHWIIKWSIKRLVFLPATFLLSTVSFHYIKSVHFKKPVAQILFLSKLWCFQYKSKQKVPQFWKKQDSRNWLLKINGL